MLYDIIYLTEAYNSCKYVSYFKYYFTGINYVFIYPGKDDATAIVKEYVSMVATRYGRVIRFIRLDGEKSLGNEFQDYTKRKGITVERSPTYT